jgi:hypothetical protein
MASRWVFALGALASVVCAALGIEPDLGDGPDVEHVVHPPFPGAGEFGAGSAAPLL